MYESPVSYLYVYTFPSCLDAYVNYSYYSNEQI